MPVDCQRSVCGGKGNLGLFIERGPRICAAGIPTAQPDDIVKDCLQHYLLKDKVDALVSDAIKPVNKPKSLPPLRHPLPLDKRFAGPFGQICELINPPTKTKFQTLVSDFKDTHYSTYWKKPLGGTADQVPMLPEGFDTLGTTFGKKTEFHGRLYNIVLPKEPVYVDTQQKSQPGVQSLRHYCSPPFNPDLTFGYRTHVDKRGSYAKCCVTDRRISLGNSQRTTINSIQSDMQMLNQPRLGTVLAPNDNISILGEGHSFGKVGYPDNLPECLTFCKINPEQEFFRKCLAHLNSLRKCLSVRFLPTFFRKFYLNIKFYDKDKSGWLQKEIIYNECASRLIRFDSTLIEHLLCMWKAFDGTCIEYKLFVHILNFKEPLPELPKIMDIPLDCLDFRTTYSEMVKPGQEDNKLAMAGLPSGRYFDLGYPITPEKCCKADRTCLPHESDAKSCLSPSILTLLHVNHRDMYATRSPENVKKIFEAAEMLQGDKMFDDVWEEAQKYHSEGLVCYETFRKALDIYAKNEK